MSNQEKPIDYALTTKARVKDRLSITETGFDTLFDRLIAAVTDMIEGECNRRFKQTTYTNEVYSVFNPNQKMLALNQIPIVSISSFQYRFGLKSSPNWTDFNTDDWEIVNDGGSGLVRVYGLYSNINAVRVSYVAGYLIDFANAGNSTLHQLPFDLSDLAERLVIKLFKKRENEGKLSESFQSGSVTWKDFIEDFDQKTMDGYKRLPAFM